MPARALGLALAWCCAAIVAGAEPAFAPPAPPADPAALGVGIQRTMTLLATSTPQRRNHVRILFYGQSITVQAWTKQVEAELRARFPHADLEVANRAIGGFASQLLKLPAEHDLYPFYPDLLIFHVYGSHHDYDAIIRATRSRTTAEVLMQKDHVGASWPAPEGVKSRNSGLAWDARMNGELLPEIAGRYGCALLDVRSPWLDYLRAHQLEPKALLTDDVHLNDRGDALLAALVGRYLVHRPDLPDTAWRDLVRTVPVAARQAAVRKPPPAKPADAAEPADVTWAGGTLRLRFTGNRIDAIAGAAAAGDRRTGRIRIDGKAPSAFAELACFTRPEPGPWSAPVALVRVDREAALVPEEWSLRITEISPDAASWRYEVAGTITGPDGAGSSAERFVSRSKRVVIEPGAFFRGKGAVAVGHRITWRSVPLHVDTWTQPAAGDAALERVTVLAQGLPNAEHTLEITSPDGKLLPIAALRVYRPPVR